MELYHKEETWIYFVIYNQSGTEQTGVTYQDITVEIVKYGSFGLASKTLTSETFKEIGKGVYALKLTISDLDTLGDFVVVISSLSPSPTIDIEQKSLVYQVVAKPIIPSPPPQSCTVFGNMKDLTGLPSEDKKQVRAQIKDLPGIIDKNYITVDPIIIFTDVDGLFKLKLIRGTTVLIEMPDVGFKKQMVVPDQDSIDIADIP